MAEEILHRRGTTLVRRMRLAPSESTTWHRDPCHRVSVILSGDGLGIEYRDGTPGHHVKLTPGQVDWDEPSDHAHCAVNVGDRVYEEITIFFLEHPHVVPQRNEE